MNIEAFVSWLMAFALGLACGRIMFFAVAWYCLANKRQRAGLVTLGLIDSVIWAYELGVPSWSWVALAVAAAWFGSQWFAS